MSAFRRTLISFIVMGYKAFQSRCEHITYYPNVTHTRRKFLRLCYVLHIARAFLTVCHCLKCTQIMKNITTKTVT